MTILSATKDPFLLASAYNNLAWIGCVEEKDLEEALGWATKADELQPEDSNILDTTAWVLYKLGRYPEAREKLTTAVAKNAQDPLLRYHLGMTLFKEGRAEEALRQLKMAVSFSTTFEGVDEAKQTIAELEQ